MCSSFIGRKSGQQKIRLDTQCGRSNVIHEIIHALGFSEEHLRKDRNKYVKIQWENIIKNKHSQFEIIANSTMPWESIYFGLDYDAKSIMHSKKTDFTRNGQNTIVPTVRILAIFK